MPAGSWEEVRLRMANGHDATAWGWDGPGSAHRVSSRLTGPRRLWLPHLNRDGALGRREDLATARRRGRQQ